MLIGEVLHVPLGLIFNCRESNNTRAQGQKAHGLGCVQEVP